MDLAFSNVQLGHPLPEDISFERLKATVHADLLQISNLFDEDQVEHVYEKLFDVIPSAPELLDEPFVQQDAVDSASNVDGHVTNHHTQLLDHSHPAHTSSELAAPQNTSIPAIGILIIRTDPKAVWGIPKVKSVDIFAQHLKTWTKAGIMSMFILRNVFSRQLEFDVSHQTMAIDPRCPLVFSPEKYCFFDKHPPLTSSYGNPT